MDPTTFEPLAAQVEQTLARFIEEQIPFNKKLGLRVDCLRQGFAALRLPFDEELIGDPMRPALHGGSISMLADTAGGAAVFASTDLGTRVSTIDLRIDYLRPGALRDLLAEAAVLRMGNKVGVSRIRIFQPQDVGNESDEARTGDEGARRLIAEATAVYSIRRA